MTIPLLLAALAAAATPAAAAGPARAVSARAIGHYLEARRAEAAGDLARASEELRLARIFDEESAQIRALLLVAGFAQVPS